jgi:hypothetical protein
VRWALLEAGLLIFAAPLLVAGINSGRASPLLVVAGIALAAVAGLNSLWVDAPDEVVRRRRRFNAAVVLLVACPLLVLVIAKGIASKADQREEVRLPPAGPRPALPEAAMAHSPILLFDTDERFRTPLDVKRMLETGDVEMCPERASPLTTCQRIYGPRDLRNGFGDLRFDPQEIEDENLPTTIYAHVVPDELYLGWTDIDYWWYLTNNPANTAQGAMCGAGLVIPDVTCFDHQSDWEGATLVLDQDMEPQFVHYAAHNHVISVPWSALQDAAEKKPLQEFATKVDLTNHPPVFVARGTHAGYPLPCDSSSCSGDTIIQDTRHDGAHVWPEERCSADACVTPFPVPAQGVGNASWNAFDGRWGTAFCLTRDLYCASSNAPKAPGNQGRYLRPWCYDLATGRDLARPTKAEPPECQ